MPPSQAPTGYDVRFLARRGQRRCGRTGEGEGGEQGSRDPGKAPDRLGRGNLLVGNRLEGTRLEGNRQEGNRPGIQQQKQQKWQLLGPLSLVTSVPIASIPNPHLCASRVCSVVPLA